VAGQGAGPLERAHERVHRRVDRDGSQVRLRAPGIEEGTFAEFDVSVGEHVYHIRSRPGVFSWEHLDAGTRLLLEHTPIHVTDRVLDVGCGYGIIGIHTALIAHKGHATLVDVDALACQSARASLEANGIRHADVIIGDGLKAVGDRHYTLILSNPPFHSGHRVTLNIAETFVRDAYTALEPRGRLVIVANRFLPYDRIMNEVFGAVTTLAQTSRFHLLLAEKARLREAPEKKKPVDGSVQYEYYLPGWAIALIVVGAVLSIGGTIALIVLKKRNKEKNSIILRKR